MMFVDGVSIPVRSNASSKGPTIYLKLLKEAQRKLEKMPDGETHDAMYMRYVVREAMHAVDAKVKAGGVLPPAPPPVTHLEESLSSSVSVSGGGVGEAAGGTCTGSVASGGGVSAAMPRSSSPADKPLGQLSPPTRQTLTDATYSVLMWTAVLSSFFWRQGRLSELALLSLCELHRETPLSMRSANVSLQVGSLPPVWPSTRTSDLADDGSPITDECITCAVQYGIFLALGLFLSTTKQNTSLNMALKLIEEMMQEENTLLPFCKSLAFVQLFRSCLVVYVETTSNGARMRSRGILDCLVRVASDNFLASAKPSAKPLLFRSVTVLENYVKDVSEECPFVLVDVDKDSDGGGDATDEEVEEDGEVSDGATAPEQDGVSAGGGDQQQQQLSPLPGSNEEQKELVMSLRNALPSPPVVRQDSFHAHQRSYNPQLTARRSLDDNLVQQISSMLKQDGSLPTSLISYILALRMACRAGSTERSMADRTLDVAKYMRERQIGLRLLFHFVKRLPPANSDYDHRCATWLSVSLMSCRYDIVSCVSRNLLEVEPFELYETSLQILSHLLQKCHHPLARELHSLLAVYLLPTTASPFASYRQKRAVLSMMTELLSKPRRVVSFFINYDCNPSFDPNGNYRGMIELLVSFVTDTMYSSQQLADGGGGSSGDAKGTLTLGQQRLLRFQCVQLLHTLTLSMYRWISEEPAPTEAMHACYCPQSSRQKSPAIRDPVSAPLSPQPPDNKTTESTSSPFTPVTNSFNVPAAAAAAAAGMAGASALPQPSPQPTPQPSPQPPSEVPIGFHWKHVHHLRHNKFIGVEACKLVGEGRWREAKIFLEARGYIPTMATTAEELQGLDITPGRSSYKFFTRFLFDYPHLDRQGIQAIFERINKVDDAGPRYIAKEYMHLMDYRGTPVDIAFRDTTCRFVSWDRPMLESQTWETIQRIFGEEYASQNPRSCTASDAETLAGALLFLHSTLHNASAKSEAMSEELFARSTLECLEFPMDIKEMKAIYRRVSRQKWALDVYGRTPQEVERANTCEHISALVSTQRNRLAVKEAEHYQRMKGRRTSAVKNSADPSPSPTRASGLLANQANATDTEDGGSTPLELTLRYVAFEDTYSDELQSVFEEDDPTLTTEQNSKAVSLATPISQLVSKPPIAGNHQDLHFLDPDLPSYLRGLTEQQGAKLTTKLTKDGKLWLHAAKEHLKDLEVLHELFYLNRHDYRPLPYVVPFYAEHIRLVYLTVAPSVVASMYFALRTTEEAPTYFLISEVFQLLDTIGASFRIPPGTLQEAVGRTVQQYVADASGTFCLPPPSRAGFSIHMMHVQYGL